MDSKKIENICPNCGTKVENNVCQKCGHIMNYKILNEKKFLTKNVKYNVFLIGLYLLGAVLFAIGSIEPIKLLLKGQKEFSEGMPTIACVLITTVPAICFILLLLKSFIRKFIILKKGKEVNGIVYGYSDALYEYEKGVREEICYIVLENDKETIINIPFNLGNSKSLTQEDRPYPVGKKLKIKIYKDMFCILN